MSYQEATELSNKPELRYCTKCQSHTPHIIIFKLKSNKQEKKKFCLVCCKKSNFNEKHDTQNLDPKCEYCSLSLGFNGDKNRQGRRFCRNGRCATNQNKFIKLWQNRSVGKINIKIGELRKILANQSQNRLTQEKIGITLNQITLLFNIRESKRISQVQQIRT